MFEYGKIINYYCCTKVKFKFIRLPGRSLTNTEQLQQKQQRPRRRRRNTNHTSIHQMKPEPQTQNPLLLRCF